MKTIEIIGDEVFDLKNILEHNNEPLKIIYVSDNNVDKRKIANTELKLFEIYNYEILLDNFVINETVDVDFSNIKLRFENCKFEKDVSIKNIDMEFVNCVFVEKCIIEKDSKTLLIKNSKIEELVLVPNLIDFSLYNSLILFFYLFLFCKVLLLADPQHLVHLKELGEFLIYSLTGILAVSVISYLLIFNKKKYKSYLQVLKDNIVDKFDINHETEKYSLYVSKDDIKFYNNIINENRTEQLKKITTLLAVKNIFFNRKEYSCLLNNTKNSELFLEDTEQTIKWYQNIKSFDTNNSLKLNFYFLLSYLIRRLKLDFLYVIKELDCSYKWVISLFMVLIFFGTGFNLPHIHTVFDERNMTISDNGVYSYIRTNSFENEKETYINIQKNFKCFVDIEEINKIAQKNKILQDDLEEVKKKESESYFNKYSSKTYEKIDKDIKNLLMVPCPTKEEKEYFVSNKEKVSVPTFYLEYNPYIYTATLLIPFVESEQTKQFRPNNLVGEIAILIYKLFSYLFGWLIFRKIQRYFGKIN